jgi:hypothetical protein
VRILLKGGAVMSQQKLIPERSWKACFNVPTAAIPGHIVKAENDAETPICNVWVGGGLRGKARQIAVVNLIAAAPELLVACKALSDLYTHAWDVTTGGMFMNSDGVEKFEAAHAQAVDAIAKATGKAVRS